MSHGFRSSPRGAWFSTPKPSEITPKSWVLNRRQALGGLSLAGFGFGLGAPAAQAALSAKASAFSTKEAATSKEAATTYNNFYEFGLEKSDPARFANTLVREPWTLKIDGLVNKPQELDVAKLIGQSALEERIYRLRCVEGWSMVIPWIGIPLADVLKKADPQGSAKYVGFETLNDAKQMPGIRRSVLDWPYREGLRLDEALHPLTLLAVGMYGDVLPNQNGAPIRLVVPWKYGFKSIKSIVRITLAEQQPATAWNRANAREYGFYSNVNPEVDHPRWSQASERRIGEFSRRPTLMFNGYGDQVAGLYAGLDLKANY